MSCFMLFGSWVKIQVLIGFTCTTVAHSSGICVYLLALVSFCVFCQIFALPVSIAQGYFIELFRKLNCFKDVFLAQQSAAGVTLSGSEMAKLC